MAQGNQARADLNTAAAEERSTRKIRESIRDADEAIWELGVQRTKLEAQFEEALDAERLTAAYAEVADAYRANIEFLKRRANVLRAEAELASARKRLDEVGVSHDHQRRAVGAARLGLPIGVFHPGPRGKRAEGAKLVDEPRLLEPELEFMAGPASDGGRTVAEVTADIKRFERLAAEADERGSR